ncbi:MAG: VWA domain-containing protein [Archangium sp.]|nr:VWA domain-containing protein [Archangium sp.]
MFKKTLLAACAAALTAAPCLADEKIDPKVDPKPVIEVKADAPKIQIAILIDTSGSMDGLINQTREQLWRIVNTFATAKKEGKRPRLELALYQYGNDSIPASAHHVQKIVPLTTDLDKVSEALFKLSTNGGNEYCGAAISHALGELEWSSNPKDLKLIYIAGNEPFTQGPIAFRDAVKTSINKGIVVNTIHAGTQQQGISDSWAEAAKLADGNFLFIDSNRAVARVDAPQDAELARLSNEMNKTYIAYGRTGKESVARQEAQDKNASGMSAGSASTRAAAKASPMYRNDTWDLVDAKKGGKSVISFSDDELPAEMKPMKPEEREKYVEGKAKERAEIQAKISKLNAEREQYVQAEMKKKAADTTKTMDDALIESARGQAEKAAFSF